MKVKKGQYTRGVLTDSEEEEDWPVRYRKPTYRKRGGSEHFTIPYSHTYHDGHHGMKTVTYYVCPQQVRKGKIMNKKPYLIRPSFVGYRKYAKRQQKITRHKHLSDHFINGVRKYAGMPPLPPLLSSSQESTSQENGHTNIAQFFGFNMRNSQPTPPPATPTQENGRTNIAQFFGRKQDINPAPSAFQVDHDKSLEDIFQATGVDSSGDENLPPISDVFNMRNSQPTPPPATPTPPPSTQRTPPTTIEDNDHHFHCQFQSKDVSFQLYIKK
jgi:hypothetical protein